MEVRYVPNGKNKPAVKVFFSDEAGFEVASVIIVGKEEAALIDAQWTLSNAHRVVSEIIETGKRLSYIYVTHAHPDHYFGLGPIAAAFPQAKVIALPSVAKTVNAQFFGKIEHWEQTIGVMNVPRVQVPIEPMEHNWFELEGTRVEIIPEVMGDLRFNTVAWIPAIKTLYGSDVLFNQAHPFTCEVTTEERVQWINDIEKLRKLGATTIIPGHQKPGMPFDESSMDFTIDYLKQTEEALATTQSEGDFYYDMVKRFPDANLFISNTMNAGFFKGGMDWNWRDE